MKRLPITALGALAAAAAQAHPGHGLVPSESLLHVLEPQHVLPLLAGVALVWGLLRLRARKRRDEAARKTKHER